MARKSFNTAMAQPNTPIDPSKVQWDAIDPSKVQWDGPTPAQQQQSSAPRRFLQGMRDPIDAGAQLLTHMLPDSLVKAGNDANNWLADKTGLVGRIPEGGLDQSIADQEKQYEGARAATGNTGMDWMRLAGNIASPANVAVGTATASKIPMGTSLVNRLLAGAGAGAVGGVTSRPVADGDFWHGKAAQAGMGAAGGAATSGLAAGVARIISPETRDNISRLLTEGVTPTPGQILGGAWQKTEDKLTSVPILGDIISSARGKGLDEFNRAAYKRALAPIGGGTTAPIGHEAITDVRGQLGRAYDNLLPFLNFKADNQFAGDLNKISGMASSMPQTQANQFQKILQEKVIGRLGPKGTMDGEAFKGVESELGQLAKGYRSDPSFDNRQLGDAISELQTSLRGTLVRANPQYAKQLQEINEGYANYTRLRGAAAMQGAETTGGKFTPAQLSTSVRAQDKTVGKRAFSEGTALMQDLSGAGKDALSPKYPDTGTAGRLAVGAGALAGLAGGAVVSPAIGGGAIGLGALASLPYLPIGRQLSAALLARRPDVAKPIADLVRKIGPYAGPALLAPSSQPGQN